MSVLVTGGAGYIGSHTVRALVEAGESVVVVDNLSTGFSAYLPEGVALFIGDAADENLVEGVIAAHAVESIVHLAGSVVVPDSMRDPLAYYRNNTMTTRSLLNAAVKSGVSRFIYSSAAAVYGNPDQVPVIANNEVMQKLEENYANLRGQYVEALNQYGPNYPKVLRLDKQVKEASALIAAERGRIAQRIRNEYFAAARRAVRHQIEHSVRARGVVDAQAVARVHAHREDHVAPLRARIRARREHGRDSADRRRFPEEPESNSPAHAARVEPRPLAHAE